MSGDGDFAVTWSSKGIGDQLGAHRRRAAAAAQASAKILICPGVVAGKAHGSEVTDARSRELTGVGDLGPVGFPGDDAWADQDFCGGLGGSVCSSSVRSKLVTDPF